MGPSRGAEIEAGGGSGHLAATQLAGKQKIQVLARKVHFLIKGNEAYCDEPGVKPDLKA
jgi:hypothetical protein